MRITREDYVALYLPPGVVKVADKRSDAVAYLYQGERGPCACVFYGKQGKPVARYRYRTPAEREASVRKYFEARQATHARKEQNKADSKVKALEMAQEIKVGDIFHYSYGYDETHHVFVQVVEVKGRHVITREIAQAQKDLGYDWRHRCMPQSDNFIGKPTRHLVQVGYIKCGNHYAHKWNTQTVAGVKIGPSYVGGGCH